MTEEILINVAPMETRVALLDNGVLQEVYLERVRKRGIVGNIYRGKIVRVLPGMQAAFVDIGLDKAAFIHASDIAVAGLSSRNKEALEKKLDSKLDNKKTDIALLIKEGDPIVVQVIKDPIGTKGARLTSHLSVSSRFLVYMPNTQHIGISQRIEGEGERERLRGLVEVAIKEERLDLDNGFIVRTVAEGASNEDINKDVKFLVRLWKDLHGQVNRTPPPGVIYEDLPLYLRTMRDLVRPQVDKVRIDSEEEYQRLLKFTEDYEPAAKGLIEHYDGERPIFDLYGVEDEIEKALSNTVQLKSGGSIVLDQTESMTTIDVNTGAFVGRHNQEETIYKTNLEAAAAIARQLRLRNLGGIIIIDFIDMQDEEHRRHVLRNLEKNLAKDRTKTQVMQISDLGLVEMTRKRTRESLERSMCEPCQVCDGRGMLKSAETVCYEIFREVLREAKTYDANELFVLASQPVIDRLLDEDSASVADMEELTNTTIRFQVEQVYSQSQYDIVLK